MAKSLLIRANEEDMMYAWIGRRLSGVKQSPAVQLDVEYLLAQIVRRVHKVVIRTGRMALGSAVQRSISTDRVASPAFMIASSSI